jgi:hypothetical protein
MEKFNLLVRQARTYFETADHLIYVTYPMIEETKMLLVVVENLYRASVRLVSAVLQYERMYKRIMALPLEFEGKLKVFEKVSSRFKIPSTVVETVYDLWDIMQKHEKSPMEFARKDKFVITGEQFEMKTIDVTLLKKYVSHIRTFLSKIETIKQ